MRAAANTTPAAIKRLRITVRGVVQGVGFRPFVYACATGCGLTGVVGNESGGVFIEVEGPPCALARFQRELTAAPPPLAHIEEVAVAELAVAGSQQFVIAPSEASAVAAHTLISPDIAVCDDCLCELFDPVDRRYCYPFTNCTNCGPRFTITRGLPYDRPLTTMAGFVMCAECQREYDNPRDRRFHAQPNACPECGPQIEFRWVDEAQAVCRGEDAMRKAQRALVDGCIVAVKGIGGFHLACDAANDTAVRRLRERKGRVDKPFAVMARDLAAAARYAEINEHERALLVSKERPIVLLRKRAGSELSAAIAPGNNYLGVMLPYSPLHHVLLNPADAACEPCDMLVMTSGNCADEPIAKDNAEALERLAPLADAFLLHDRDIHLQCDDSVVRVFAGRELPLRRSRGYAPFPVKLPFALPPTLAVGGELKSAFCLVNGGNALLSQHLGDMENLETLRAFEQTVKHFKTVFRVEPEVVAADKHPRYLSAQWAKAHLNELSSRPVRYREVQHHHAHVAAVMAENGLRGEQPVIGFAFDGTGYGDDGAIWGGEVLLADYRQFRRAAHLRYVPLPGGDAAIRRPYRAALAHLWAADIAWDDALPPVGACSLVERQVLLRQLQADLNCVPTSSMGRLFDAVASLAGVRQTVTYEAQAAIEFEALATEADGQYEFTLSDDDPIQIGVAVLLHAVVRDVLTVVAASVMAAKFHRAVAELILQLSLRIRARTQLNQVALGGGVFQNVILLAAAVNQLGAAGFEVFTHRLVPPNDGGLALGQAVVANFLPDDDQAARAFRPRRGRCH